MVAIPTIGRSIGEQCRRISKPYLSRFSDRQWQFQSYRCLILEPISDSVKLRRLSDSDSGIVELNLDRPGAKNAIGRDMLRGLQHSLETIKGDHSARVMMISSSVPKVFCAGADLKERRAMSPTEVQSFVNTLRSTFSLLEEQDSIAYISGVKEATKENTQSGINFIDLNLPAPIDDDDDDDQEKISQIAVSVVSDVHL